MAGGGCGSEVTEKTAEGNADIKLIPMAASQIE